MKFAELIDHCIDCIKGYNPVIKTVDSHADDFLSKVSVFVVLINCLQFKDPYEKVFVKQVFYGVIRYQEFLKVFNKIFYERFPVGANRNDFTLYLVFGYISFFRLEELSIDDYKKLVSSQDPVKLNSFLSFVFNGDLLRQYVREEWMTLFDYTYIDEKIIG